jgi:hypothetical protein
VAKLNINKMKNLLAKLKPVIQVLLVVVTITSLYVALATLVNASWFPVPFKVKPDTVAKILSTATTLLSGLLTWIAFRVNIEMFSGSEVAAGGYYETFCQKVVENNSLKPCYIFIPDKLAQLRAENDIVAAIKSKNLSCDYDKNFRVYIVKNSKGEKAYLDFPSTLKNLAIVAEKSGKLEKSSSLEVELISGFQKQLEKKHGMTFKAKGTFRKIKELFGGKKAARERTDAIQFYFINPDMIRDDAEAGFKKLAA